MCISVSSEPMPAMAQKPFVILLAGVAMNLAPVSYTNLTLPTNSLVYIYGCALLLQTNHFFH